ncbi:hypothetical protein TCDM_12116 [Trypanosoma cruzi Dm28c]|uniref:Uncharacterized protein n=1 Tax=Trypanosoma cruzi Dm28c TaxID=1416333 RepID=V5B332_TRYCR|nr:hypothetical protein TCDM_12116 [Trypanosoma cruzi Dm28c]
MDSDQHLPSHTAGTEDGIPQQAGMVPRRKHAALALRDADCDASTSACVTPLATVTTWLVMRKCTIPRGSRDSPTKITTDGMEQAESVSAAACNERTFLPEAACPELKCSANGRSAIIPFAVFSPCCQRPVRNSLVPSRAQVCDSPKHGGTISLPSGIGCTAALLGPRLCAASAAGNPLVRHTVRVALAAILTVVRTPCAPVTPGDWNINWPFTPCAPESAIRDCLPGVAPSAY